MNNKLNFKFLITLPLTVGASCFLFFTPSSAQAPAGVEEQINTVVAENNLGRARPESPQSRQTAAPRSEGFWQAFERGWVYWHPRYGAKLVKGKIFEEWGRARWEQGLFGFPVRGEQECATGDRRDRFQRFEGGTITWSAATNQTGFYTSPGTPDQAIKCSSGTPGAARARFRISVNGFLVRRETVDNALETDGKGDEVFIRAEVADVDTAVDFNANVPRLSSIRSVLMGDTNGQRGRDQAGSKSDKGGLKFGDAFPSRTPWVQTSSLVRPVLDRDYYGNNHLPLLLWEGELRDRQNCAVILPSIWEWDNGGGDTALYYDRNLPWWWNGHPYFFPNGWVKNFAALYARGLNEVLNPIEQDLRIGREAPGLFGLAEDRPIGMKRLTGRVTVERFTPSLYIFTYRTAAEAAQRRTQYGEGIIPVVYEDSPELGGAYVLFLQVERLP